MNSEKSTVKDWIKNHKPKAILFGVLGLFILFAIIGNLTGLTSQPKVVQYKIIWEKADYAWDVMPKTKIKIQLDGEPTKERLTEIANEIRTLKPSYKQVYIWYYLPKTDTSFVTAQPYAFTHFLPELQIQIMPK